MKKGKNKSKKNNKTCKLFIIISIFILLLIISLGIITLIYRLNKKDKLNSSKNTITKAEQQNKAKEMLYNNYLISYILEGDVEIGEGTLMINETNEVYYAVNDSQLTKIHTLSDIYNLIDNNLSPTAAQRARKLMESSYANQYTYNDDTLYVRKTISPCEIIADGPIQEDKIKYRFENDSAFAIYNNVPYQGFFDENMNLKANVLWFACSKNFPNTKTGKNDVYNPY